MRINYIIPLGVSAPCGILLKQDPYTLIAAGLSTAGSIVNNQINAERAASDMAQYYHMLGVQRDWQKQDWERNRDYTYDLLENQRAYDSPSAEMARLKAAGLNPYLVGQEGNVGTGSGVSPSQPNNPERGSLSPLLRPQTENVMASAADKIFAASSVKSQRLGAISEVAKAAPSLVKSVGKDAATRMLSSLFGSDVDTDLVDSIVRNEALQAQYRTKVDQVEARIAEVYGEKEASNRVAIQEQQFNKMAAEIGLMASEGKVNEAKVNELVSSYIRNIADAWKLRREGDYFVANAQTVNDIRTLTISSLEAELTKAGFENRIKGYYQGSGLDNYLKSNYHSKKTSDIMSINETYEGSELVKALDRILGRYLKVSASN